MAFEITDKIDTLYLFNFYLLYGQRIAFDFAQGTKQQSLPRNILSLIPIFYPPERAEQEKIAQFLQNGQQEIDFLSQYRSMLHIQKRSLMQKLLTGAIRVGVDE